MNVATGGLTQTLRHPTIMSEDGRSSIGTDDSISPTTELPGVTEQDIICGRSSATKTHQGNKMFRELVNKHKRLYASCRRSEKYKISLSIVNAIQNVGGRFLQLDTGANEWHDIGDKKALEKVSQALREGQPELRQKLNITTTTDTLHVADQTASFHHNATPPSSTLIPPNLSNGPSEKVAGAIPTIEINTSSQHMDGPASQSHAEPLDLYHRNPATTTINSSGAIAPSDGASARSNAYHSTYCEPASDNALYYYGNEYDPQDWTAIAKNLSDDTDTTSHVIQTTIHERHDCQHDSGPQHMEDLNTSHVVPTVHEYMCEHDSGQQQQRHHKGEEEDLLSDESTDVRYPRRRASFPGLMASTSVQHDLYASIRPPLASNLELDRTELMEKGVSAMSLMSEFSLDGQLLLSSSSIDDILVGLRFDEMSTSDPFHLTESMRIPSETSRRTNSLFRRPSSLTKRSFPLDHIGGSHGEFTMESSARSLMTYSVSKINNSGRSLMSTSDFY